MTLARHIKCSLIATLVATGTAFAQQVEHASESLQLSTLQQQVDELQKQNQQLSLSLAHSRTQADETQKKLDTIRLELEALKIYPLGSDDERLVQAVANRKVLEERLQMLESASLALTDQVREYLKQAFNADPAQRAELESRIRGLDELLGIIHKPRPQIDLGSITSSKIVAVDSNTNLLILNAGEKQKIHVGMTFRILRGKSQIAEAIIAEVRPEIAGALVVKLEDTNNAVRLGDIASIKTQ